MLVLIDGGLIFFLRILLYSSSKFCCSRRTDTHTVLEFLPVSFMETTPNGSPFRFSTRIANLGCKELGKYIWAGDAAARLCKYTHTCQTTVKERPSSLRSAIKSGDPRAPSFLLSTHGRSRVARRHHHSHPDLGRELHAGRRRREAVPPRPALALMST
jgi:hypothetical protein